MAEQVDFSAALTAMKTGKSAIRAAWKPNKMVQLRDASDGIMSYLEIVYIDGSDRCAPWTPTRCDLLETDWRVL